MIQSGRSEVGGDVCSNTSRSPCIGLFYTEIPQLRAFPQGVHKIYCIIFVSFSITSPPQQQNFIDRCVPLQSGESFHVHIAVKRSPDGSQSPQRSAQYGASYGGGS